MTEGPTPTSPDALRRMVATVTGRLLARVGPHHVQDVEDCVQDAVLRALETWPYRGTPEQPQAWLARVAWHRWVDRYRQRVRAHLAADQLATPVLAPHEEDDHATLHAVFVCASEAVPPSARIALTLRLACGLGVSETATLLEVPRATLDKRLTRGRAALAQVPLSKPYVRRSRLPVVLETLAALFTSGIETMGGTSVTGPARASEALYLMDDVLAHPVLHDASSAWGCAAWMRLTAARLPARCSSTGRVSLREQDRRLWSSTLLRSGLGALGRAAAGEVSAWHLMAAIAAVHAEAATWADTDWVRVRQLHEDLVHLRGSEGDHLGLAVAVWHTSGPQAARDDLRARPQSSAPYFALQAELSEALGEDADAHWASAMAQAHTDADRAYYASRRGPD